MAKADGPRKIAFTLLAASGLCAGEAFGLEVRHFVGNTLSENCEGSQPGYIREAVVSDSEETQIVPAEVELAIYIDLVLLPVLKPIKKTVAVRGL